MVQSGIVAGFCILEPRIRTHQHNSRLYICTCAFFETEILHLKAHVYATPQGQQETSLSLEIE